MGLGLRVKAELPRVLRERSDRGELFEAMAKAARSFAKAQPPPLQEWFSAWPGKDSIAVSLFPIEENVEFSREGERLACSAKTSTAGPGYHAYLNEFLDALAVALGLAWQEADADWEDETGYRKSRAFGGLQDAMALFVKQLAQIVLTKIDDFETPILLGMPVGFAPRSKAFIASPKGEWSREWTEEVAGAEGSRLRELAAEYFPWWDRGASARNLRSFALARCWMDVRWTVPQDADERSLCEFVLRCFEEARRLDSSLLIPREAEELRRLLTPDAALVAPAPEGVGYRRRAMGRSLPGGWSIELPGYFSEERESDGSTQVYYFLDKTVRASTFTARGPEGATAADLLSHIAEGEVNARPLSLAGDHLAGKFMFERDENEGCFLLRAYVARADAFCVASIYFEDERERPWAEAAAATLFAPPLERDSERE